MISPISSTFELGSELAAQGVRYAEVTVTPRPDTDTPAIFGTTLTAEAELLRSAFGLSDAAAEQVLQNAVDASFLPPGDKTRLAFTSR